MGAFKLGNNAELGTEEIQALYIRGISDVPKFYQRIFNVQDTDNSLDKDYSLQGMGLIPVKNEDVDLTTISINKNGIKVYAQGVRAASMKITWEVLRFGKLGIVEKLVHGFAESFIQTMDTVAHLPINNLLSANPLYIMPDGLSVANINHVMGNGAIQGNGPAGFATVLTRANVETQLARISALKNDGGLPLIRTPMALYCAAGLGLRAQEILHSASRPDWFSGANAKNVLNDLNLEIIADPYITDSTSWGILCRKPKNREMSMYVAEYPKEIKESNVERNFDVYYSSLLSMTSGISDWMDIFPSYCV